MTRIQLACFSLIASAFVLAGLLIVNLSTHVTHQAHAGLVMGKDTLTLLTARTRSDEEAHVVLEKRSLLVKDDSGNTQASVAGVLMCSEHPETHLPGAFIEAVCYQGVIQDLRGAIKDVFSEEQAAEYQELLDDFDRRKAAERSEKDDRD